MARSIMQQRLCGYASLHPSVLAFGTFGRAESRISAKRYIKYLIVSRGRVLTFGIMI